MSPKNKMQYMKLEEVIPYVNNPRNNEDAVEKVASSIHEFGFQQPIMVDKDNTIICGHTRYHAAKRLKLDTVPVVVSENLTPVQVKAYRIADNKVSEFSSWNDDLLFIELEQLKDMDFNIEFTGFSEEEINSILLDSESSDVSCTDDDVKNTESNFNYSEQYGIIVMCESEEQQEQFYNELMSLGYNCKVVAT